MVWHPSGTYTPGPEQTVSSGNPWVPGTWPQGLSGMGLQEQSPEAGGDGKTEDHEEQAGTST